MTMEGLGIRSIEKSFGANQVLKGISFHQEKGEILGVLGPSGSGKTTLLEIIAGLVQPDSGDCTWDGKSFLHIPPHQRNFGLMFQEYVLFPHKDVAENISFGLRMAEESREDIKSRVAEVLDLVGLPGFGGRDVATLSGGEQQRVALARSLAPEPRLVMLDEPLGALDRTIRERLIEDLRGILKDANQTALYVTHDQEEAFTIADRVVILGEGKTVQLGTPQEIYYQPQSPYIARFLGLTNLIEGKADTSGSETRLISNLGTWPYHGRGKGEGLILLRPDQVSLGKGKGSRYEEISGILTSSSFTGANFQVLIQTGDYQLKFTLSNLSDELFLEGEEITLYFDPHQALHFYPHSGDLEEKE
jgi:ABC-type Fe3+/spermidine/putrescine transport system ATPase subunit